MTLKTTLIAALLVATAGSASAGCIGPTIMGECHGTVTPFETHQDRSVRVSPTVEVTPNAYGMGVGSDQFARPFHHHPLWNGERNSIFQPGGLGNIWAGN